MARDISVSIAVQGEREFNQALKNAQSAVKVLSSELKASEAAFDESADAQAFFANKTRNLNAQIEQQRLIYENLQKAVQDASNEFGAASAKTDKYRIEMNKTEAAISKLEKTLRDTEKEAEELGRDSTRIGRQLKDGLGDAADDVSNDLSQMVKELNSDLSDIGKSVDISAAIDIGGAISSSVSGVLGALNDLTEGTEDYRRSMSFLETSAILEGIDFEQLKKYASETASVTGDLDNAMEGMQHLAATGFDMKELAESIELVTGAVIKFPSMDFASISEGILETIQTGNATGGFLELLEKLGTGEEKIKALNEALSSTNVLESRHQGVLGYLNEQGLEQYVSLWRELHPEMQAAEEAQIRLLNAQAELAKSFTPFSTAGTNAMAGLIEGLTGLVNAFNAAEEESKARIQEMDQAVKDAGLQEEVLDLNDKIIEAYQQGDGKLAKELEAEHDRTIQKIEEFKKDYAEKWSEPIEVPETTESVSLPYDEDLNANQEQYIQNFKDAVNKQMQETFSEETDGDKAAWDAFQQMMFKGVTAGEEEFNNTVSTLGTNTPTLFANAVAENQEVALTAASNMMANLKSILHEQIVIPAPKLASSDSYTSGGSLRSTLTGGDNSTVVLNAVIEGRTVANAVADDVAVNLGERTDHYYRYG